MTPELLDEQFRIIEKAFGVAFEGDPIDERALASALERVSSFRTQVILLLVRKFVALLRIKGCYTSPALLKEPEAEPIVERFGWLLFTFFAHRQIATAMDITANWLSDKNAAGTSERYAEEVIRIIANKSYATRDRIEAAIHGASGMHCYTPGQLIEFRQGARDL